MTAGKFPVERTIIIKVAKTRTTATRHWFLIDTRLVSFDKIYWMSLREAADDVFLNVVQTSRSWKLMELCCESSSTEYLFNRSSLCCGSVLMYVVVYIRSKAISQWFQVLDEFDNTELGFVSVALRSLFLWKKVYSFNKMASACVVERFAWGCQWRIRIPTACNNPYCKTQWLVY